MKTVHMSMSLRGALKNMTKRELAAAFTNEDGRRMTADEAKDALMDEIAKGHVVIPVGKPCEGFDYFGGGCPGHEHAA